MEDGIAGAAGFFVGLIVASVAWVAVVSRVDSRWEQAHRSGVFKEQVEKHNCKVTPRWVNGVAAPDELCVLPDGTIIQR